MKLAPAVASSSASWRLAHAVAIVRTQMGRRGLGHGHLAAVAEALRARRAADGRLDAYPLTVVQGGF